MQSLVFQVRAAFGPSWCEFMAWGSWGRSRKPVHTDCVVNLLTRGCRHCGRLARNPANTYELVFQWAVQETLLNPWLQVIARWTVTSTGA